MDQHAQGSSAPTLGEQVRRVRQYWWLVALVVAIALLGAVAATMRTGTTYTARSASIVSSNDRSPDQDAVLVLGYVEYFNGAPYQSRLADEGKVLPGVTLTARAAAASPIVLIDATAPTAAEAQTAASVASQAFRQDINQEHDQASAREIHAIEGELAALQSGQQNPSSTGEPMSKRAQTSAITDLKNRILAIQADKTNVLELFERHGGVSSQSPSLVKNVLFALVGGAVIGVLLALFASRLSPRVRTREDLAWKVGAETLVELPQPGSPSTAAGFRTGLRQLGNLVRARTSRPVMVAVAEARGGDGSAVVAWGLARQWAERGKVTVLVRADAVGAEESSRVHGERSREKSPDVTAPGKVRETMTPGSIPGMWVLDEAACPGDAVDCLDDVLAELRSFAACVVVEAPPILDVPDAPVVCAAAGRTVLVVQTGTARAQETADALTLLDRAGANSLGAVLLHTGRGGTKWEDSTAIDTVGETKLQHASAS